MDNERIEIPESGELPKVATRGWSSPTTRSRVHGGRRYRPGHDAGIECESGTPERRKVEKFIKQDCHT